MPACLPNLIVIGAMKCATTSLHRYLDLHPEVAMAGRRGLNFFCTEYNWDRGHAWYASHFDSRHRVRGDTSPRYANFPLNPGVPARMRDLLPEAKLVYVVRDPVERFISHYTHYFAAGYEDRSLHAAVQDALQSARSGAAERNPYVCRSLYHAQLQQYLAHYPREQIHVLYYEELRDRPRETLRALFRFLRIDESFDSPGFDVVHHPTHRKRRLTTGGRGVQRALARVLPESISQDGRERLTNLLTYPLSHGVARPDLGDDLMQPLRDLFRDDVLRLQELVGRRCGSWPD